ncbi:MAG: DNA repair protein RecO C-terminal domain-containing protein [Bacteroidales bacterium]|nr:DNA repair protein RecO C-terminal domain-containing protein [Bacteroidales bacterium]
MPSLSKSRAIVLHLTRQGDSGAVVEVIDSSAGRQPLFLRGLGRGRGVSVSAFHNLAILDVVTYATPRSSLLYLREYSPAFPLEGIRSDMSKSTTALFISEVLYRTQKRDDGDAELFKWLEESILALNDLQGPAANFHLWWMAGYCARCGFRPEDNWSPERPLFDMVSARFTAQNGLYAEDQLLSAEESQLLHRLLGATLEEALAIPLSAARRQAFSRQMIKYLSIHFGAAFDIKSLDILHAVFA